MEENFDLLLDRVLDTINETDLLKIKKELEQIKGPIVCVGSGGSKVTSSFASIILNKKNNESTYLCEPRDLIHMNTKGFNSIFLSSYSGKNYGVDVISDLPNQKYLLSYGRHEGFANLECVSSLPSEKSFISLAATLMPMSILLSYYLETNPKEIIKEMFEKAKLIKDVTTTFLIEIFTGFDTLTPSTYLDSTLAEAGLSIPLLHQKYDYCHGRSTIGKEFKSDIIYLISKRNTLDNTLLELLKSKGKSIITLESFYDDIVLDNYYLTLLSMYLTRNIALSQNKDLSKVDYDRDIVKKVYKFKGDM